MYDVPFLYRYPVSTFMDHLLRYQEEPEVKMLVLLGEVGGTEEYKVCGKYRVAHHQLG